MSMGDEDFGFGGKAVAWKHADQVIAGEDGNARRVHQVDRNERRRRRKWDCFKASAAEMVNVVRWLVVVDEGGKAVGRRYKGCRGKVRQRWARKAVGARWCTLPEVAEGPL